VNEGSSSLPEQAAERVATRRQNLTTQVVSVGCSGPTANMRHARTGFVRKASITKKIITVTDWGVGS